MMKHKYTVLLLSMFLAGTCANSYADVCADLMMAVGKSRSLAELKTLSKRSKINEIQARKCEAQLKKSPKLKNLIKAEKSQSAKRFRSHQAGVKQKLKPLESLTINRRSLQLRAEAKQKLNELQRQTQVSARKKPPARRLPVKSPAQITGITPTTLVPGLDIVIEGSNFGNTAGTVQLKLQGKTFNASINAWNDTWINAYLTDSIGGVRASDNAVIQIQIPQKSPLSRNIPFIPLYVQESASEEYGSPGSLIFPGSGTSTVFKGESLNNGWQLSSYSVEAADTHGHCELGTPSMSSGNNSLESQLKWSYGWWEAFAWCYVDIYVEGPQGINSGL